MESMIDMTSAFIDKIMLILPILIIPVFAGPPLACFEMVGEKLLDEGTKQSMVPIFRSGSSKTDPNSGAQQK